MRIWMKRLSDDERRRMDEKSTAFTLSLFIPIVPLIGFYGVVNFVDRYELVPASVVDHLLNRVDGGADSKIGLIVLVGVYFCSFAASYLGIRRLQRRRNKGMK